ncbi:hypothetical protein ACOJB1_12555 [Enterococcus innesii]|uniref:hypothetical protein n=1 Tax=Enterococcus innesii TaxID=2839759 RepID=UPI003B5AE193
MSMQRPSLSFFPYSQSAEVIKVGSPDRYGKATVSDPVSYPCTIFMNADSEPFLDYMGQQVVYTATLMFPLLVKVKVDDRIRFTDDLGKVQEKDVLAVQFKRDFSKQVIAVKVIV